MEIKTSIKQENCTKENKLRQSKRYIIYVITISWIFGFIAFNVGDFDNEIQQSISTLLFGIIPAIIAIIINKKERGNWKSLKFIHPTFKGVLLAIIIPAVYLSIIFYAEVIMGVREITDFSDAGGIIEFIIGFIIGYPILIFLILGEEIGWRGYLQDKLIASFGSFKGVFILGFIWGIWHLPIALKGYNLPNYPIFEAFISYPLLGIALSLIIAYIGYNKYSIYIAAIFHGSNNHFSGALSLVTDTKNELLHGIIFNVFYLLIIVVFGYLFWRKTNLKNL